jgi:hypothetical protein
MKALLIDLDRFAYRPDSIVPDAIALRELLARSI